ncbi:glycosyltransferase family 4 protein [Actinocrispum wychmicini]|uniref:Glycosyltransferase involved in cell wall biosynthesis n=1 Tax=Actinocrispum wychmicini TaxID=1213861 RepID=A0A4R2JYQ1_9PSEU|nr:glycosyltransferase family 4 protein [Actinocrispum wychmicini]TCO62536.1 glycosyltransferase involved in cell wall biosynthesis [Actinocrispum wychmicini]
MSGPTNLRELPNPGTLAGRPPSFLLICDEWTPGRGGISQFNRSLATALAVAGHRTTCLVNQATTGEIQDATSRGVVLRVAESTPECPNMYVPAEKVVHDSPDVVIGHDIVSGSVAHVYARRYLSARLVVIVHTPAQVEMYKRKPDPTRRVAEREALIRRICADADLVAAVGHRSARSTEAVISDGFGRGRVLPLEPGIDVVDRTRQIPATPTIVVLGRGEHPEAKGLDIAARAVAGLTTDQADLFVQGAPADRCDDLHRSLIELSGLARHRIDVRPFTDNIDQVAHALTRAALCVLPSRIEGFGLSALEAIGAGTPVLVTTRSGLAETLQRHLGPFAEPMIVDVTDDVEADVTRWRDATQRVLDGLPAAFNYTDKVRHTLKNPLSWARTVATLTAELTAATSAVSHS